MQQIRMFPLTNPEKKRGKGSFIILSHISNFSLRLDPMKPDMKGFLPYYVTNKHREYFSTRKERQPLPFHYHLNMINNDWERMVTAPLDARSDLIEKAIAKGYIDPFYKEAIVIAIQDDYSIRVPDTRTFEVLGADIVSPMMNVLKLGRFNNKVVWLDEIFNLDRYNADRESDPHSDEYPYEFRPMRYFNRVNFNLEVRRFL